MARQKGVITRAQARRLGVTDRQIAGRLTAGSWLRMYPGVYRSATTPETWPQHLLALCLILGPNVAVSHVSAGILWGLIRPPGSPIEVVVSRKVRCRLAGITVHRSRDFQLEDVERVAGLPVTSIPRTLVDLAGVLDSEYLRLAFDRAARKPGAVRALAKRLDVWRHGRRGVDALERWVQAELQRPIAVESALEAEFVAFARRYGLPWFACQRDIYDGDRFVARVDFLFPDEKVIVETDGMATHMNRDGFNHDAIRWGKLTALGYVVVRVTWDNLRRTPDAVADNLNRILEAARERRASVSALGESGGEGTSKLHQLPLDLRLTLAKTEEPRSRPNADRCSTLRGARLP